MKSHYSYSKDSYELALQAASAENPDLEKASALLEAAHDQGDRRATYAIATWHLFGNRIYKKNLPKAINLLKLAAKADIAFAHFDLAVSYETGCGVKKDKKAAYRHFLAAALNGDNNSIYEVGRCLYYGIGVSRDRKAAKIWFRKYRNEQ